MLDDPTRRRLLAATAGTGGAALLGRASTLGARRDDGTDADRHGDEPDGDGNEPGGDEDGAPDDGASDDGARPSARWTAHTEGDADASVRSVTGDRPTAFAFAASGCSRAAAIGTLGAVDGQLRVAFDYEVTAGALHERPFVAVHEDQALAYRSDEDPRSSVDVQPSRTTTGRFEATVSLDGTARVILGVEPSRHCADHDGADTRLVVRDLDLSLASDDRPTTGTTRRGTTTGTTRRRTATTGDWTTRTAGDADASVVDASTLAFRVHKCSRASATRTYGEHDGDVRVTFDYVVQTQAWYEHPYLRVTSDDAPTYDLRDDSGEKIEKRRDARTTGTVDATVPVDGTVGVELGIRPSRHCENGDHGDTAFQVSSLEIDPQ